MRHASCLKPMGLHAPEGRGVATRVRTMTDDLYKGSCKTNKIDSEVKKKPETCFKWAKSRFNPTVTI